MSWCATLSFPPTILKWTGQPLTPSSLLLRTFARSPSPLLLLSSPPPTLLLSYLPLLLSFSSLFIIFFYLFIHSNDFIQSGDFLHSDDLR
jgi:hypothetical protein